MKRIEFYLMSMLVLAAFFFSCQNNDVVEDVAEVVDSETYYTVTYVDENGVPIDLTKGTHDLSSSISGTGTYKTGDKPTISVANATSLTLTPKSTTYNKETMSASSSTPTTLSKTIDGIHEDWTVTAKRVLPDYTVTVKAGTGGTASGGGTVEKGNSVSLRQSADPNYTFTGWTSTNGQTISSSASSFVPSSSCTVTANFKAVETQTYTITVSTKSTGIEVGKKATVSLSVSGHNSMSPNSSQIVASSTSVKTWTITANKGATVTMSVSCDNYGCDFDLGGSQTKTFSNLSSNQSATIYINY